MWSNSVATSKKLLRHTAKRHHRRLQDCANRSSTKRRRTRRRFYCCRRCTHNGRRATSTETLRALAGASASTFNAPQKNKSHHAGADKIRSNPEAQQVRPAPVVFPLGAPPLQHRTGANLPNSLVVGARLAAHTPQHAQTRDFRGGSSSPKAGQRWTLRSANRPLLRPPANSRALSSSRALSRNRVGSNGFFTFEANDVGRCWRHLHIVDVQ